MYTENDPYAPPQADVVAAPRKMPRPVQRAVRALWVAYALIYLHMALNIGTRWQDWPQDAAVWSLLISALFYGVLLYFFAQGRYLARLLYAVALGARTVEVIRTPQVWQGPYWAIALTVVSFALQYLAMYWCFTVPGRSWFLRVSGR